MRIPTSIRLPSSLFGRMVRIENQNGRIVATYNGSIIASGFDAASIIQKSIIYGPVYIAPGEYIIKKSIVLHDNTIIYNDGHLIGASSSPIIYCNGCTNVSIYGGGYIRHKYPMSLQANGNFYTTPEAIKLTNCSDITIDHEVGGFSDYNEKPIGPAWALYLGSCSDAMLRIRSSYALEHVALVGSSKIQVELIGRENYDSGLLILGSKDVIAHAIVETNAPCCANGVEINASENVEVHAVLRNIPVHNVWLYADASKGQYIRNVRVYVEIDGEGRGDGIYGVELGSKLLNNNIEIDAIIRNVGGDAVYLQQASRIKLNLSASDVPGAALRFYKIDGLEASIHASNIGVLLHDRARDTGEGLVSSDIEITRLVTDNYALNIYPQIVGWPIKTTIYTKVSLAGGATENIISLNANANGYAGRIRYVRVDNSAVEVELYNVSAGVVQSSTTTSAENWPLWPAYNYILRAKNTATSTQEAAILAIIETSKPP